MRLPNFIQGDVRQTPNSILQWFRQVRDEEVDILVKNVSGNSTVNLTTDQSHNHILKFTGTLTGNINVIVAPLTFVFLVSNQTSGAFTLTVKTFSGSGITVGQGKNAFLWGDGTNVLRASADV